MDIGGIRTGVAISDELNMIATPHITLATDVLLEELESIVREYNIEVIVVGDPLNLQGADSDNSARVRRVVNRIREAFKDAKIVMQDERFTSKLASRSLVQSGMKKSRRQAKGELDKVSAALILQDYLNS